MGVTRYKLSEVSKLQIKYQTSIQIIPLHFIARIALFHTLHYQLINEDTDFLYSISGYGFV